MNVSPASLVALFDFQAINAMLLKRSSMIGIMISSHSHPDELVGWIRSWRSTELLVDLTTS